ncbi:MAG: PIN domain-containing protein [Fibrobacter sp.]|nr:PIN domain-containing protein [Fibrobacter sp.]
MIIIDTSIWIEFFRGNQPYFDQVSELIENNDVIGLSPVFGELLQGAKNNYERSIITEFWDNIYKIKEDDLFIQAGAESSRSKWLDKGVGLIDSVIITAAKKSAAFIWSLDKKLLQFINMDEKYDPAK